jgi:preprotein translocase subunit SecG
MFWTNTTIDILLFIYVIDCVFMGFVIMMQRSKQEGLGAAFGGGFTESIWGAQTSNVLVKATVWAAVVFFIVSVSLARLYSHRATLLEKGSPVQQLLSKPLAPAATNTAPAPAPAASAPTPAPAAPAKPASK